MILVACRPRARAGMSHGTRISRKGTDMRETAQYLIASTGSTLAARRVGARLATTASATSTTHVPPSTSGSVGLTSNRSERRNRVTASAAITPTTAPTTANHTD